MDALADKHEIVVLDSLEPQVQVKKLDYLNENATYAFGMSGPCRSSLKEPKVELEEDLRRMIE